MNDQHGHEDAGSQDEQAPAEGWFRFGDEPAGAEDEAAADAPAEASTPDPTPVPPPVDRAAEPEARPEPQPVAPSPMASADEEDEETHAPFVVSATPGGVDPDLGDPMDAATIRVDEGSRGFGLVGVLTVVLLAFGVGLLTLTGGGPRSADAEARAAGGGSFWYEDVDQAMDASAREGKPLLIHFTADWCPPCREMRDAVFADAGVQERLAERFITARVDLTDRGGPNDRVAGRFEVRSIPDIQVYHADGWQMQRFGYVGSAGEFLGRLDSVDGP